MTAPRLTDRILAALLECTGIAMAEIESTEGDELENRTTAERDAMQDADQWVRAMIRYRSEAKQKEQGLVR